MEKKVRLKRKNVEKGEFRDYVLAFKTCQDLLGLRDWKVYYEFTELEPGTLAELNRSLAGMTATSTLSTKKEPGSCPSFESGVHECLHLLLSELVGKSLERDTPEKEINLMEERLVRQLEKLITPLVREELAGIRRVFDDERRRLVAPLDLYRAKPRGKTPGKSRGRRASRTPKK